MSDELTPPVFIAVVRTRERDLAWDDHPRAADATELEESGSGAIDKEIKKRQPLVLVSGVKRNGRSERPRHLMVNVVVNCAVRSCDGVFAYYFKDLNRRARLARIHAR